MIFLDTNVISETMRPWPEPKVLTWIEHHGPQLHSSSIAFAEIRFGIMKVPEKQRSPRWSLALAAWKNKLDGRTHNFDDASAHIYGDIMGRAHLSGRAIEPLDGMIAAIALRHGATVATRNTGHFQIAGLKVIDPWRDST